MVNGIGKAVNVWESERKEITTLYRSIEYPAHDITVTSINDGNTVISSARFFEKQNN